MTDDFQAVNICRLETVTPLQQDLLQELVNIGLGRAAGALNQMTRCHVELQAPSVRLVRMETLGRLAHNLVDTPMDLVRLRFSGKFRGVACLLFSREAGTWLVELMFGGQQGPEDLGPYRADTLKEVGNIVLIWIISAIGQAVGCSFDFEPLDYMDSLQPLLPEEPPEGMALLINATFRLHDAVVQGDILLLFDGRDCHELMDTVDGIAEQAARS